MKAGQVLHGRRGPILAMLVFYAAMTAALLYVVATLPTAPHHSLLWLILGRHFGSSS